MIVFLFGLAIVIAVPLLRESLRKPMGSVARKQADGSFATLSQGVTHYQWLGPVRGPVAVCVHGLTIPSFVWRGFARGLSVLGYRVLIYDLYGRGYSDSVPGPQDRAYFLTQLTDLLQDQAVKEDITLVGYSMGGSIATLFAAAHPEKIRQLILLAPAGMAFNSGRMTRLIVQTQILGDWLMLAFFPRRRQRAIQRERGLPSSVENFAELQLRELKRKGYIPSILASMRGILADTLEEEHRLIQQANLPVLAIWGGEDTLIPLSALGRLAEWNRHVVQDVIEGAGHGFLYTHTDLVLDKLRETLRDGLN